MAHVGILLAAYGGPRNLDEVAPFLHSIMRTEPTETALGDARRRYLTIGGFSPLPFMAERIAVQLERELNGVALAEVTSDEGVGLLGVPQSLPRAENVKMPVVVGHLHSEPSIADAVRELAGRGARTLVVLPLSPFDSASTTTAYRAAVGEAVADLAGVRVVDAANYHLSRDFITSLTDNLAAVLFSEETKDLRPIVVFSAHSLPADEVMADSRYVDQLKETAEAVASSVGIGKADGFEALPGIDAFGGHGSAVPWLLAFQSKGRRGGEWIGPDLDAVVDAAVEQGFEAVVVSPIGFAVDHMETLYDLDVACAERALSADREFVRAAAPNDSRELIHALSEAVRKVI